MSERFHKNGRTATIQPRLLPTGKKTWRLRLYGPNLGVINFQGGKDLTYKSTNLSRLREAANLFVSYGPEEFRLFWFGY